MEKWKSLSLHNPPISAGICQVILKEKVWARRKVSEGIRASLQVSKEESCKRHSKK